MLQVGDAAPAFSLPDADMEAFDLRTVLKQHHVVIFFYPRDGTPGCILEACGFSDYETDFARCHTVVVGVSRDDCLTHAEFRDKHGLSVRLLSDPDAEVSKLYGVWQPKEVDGHTKMCILRSTFVIERDGTVRHALYDVNPRGHAQEVLQLVKQLDSGNGHANRQRHRRDAQLPGE